jgi:mono/diheme cytochrome c family protein
MLELAGASRRLREAAVMSVLLCLLLPAPGVSAAGQVDSGRTLTVTADAGKCEFQASELLRHPQIETLTIDDVSAYPRRKMTYRALKAKTLLDCTSIPSGARIEFVARDGFTANLDAGLLLNTSPDKAVAYLAVEDPAQPWPTRRGHADTAGPFYLIWKNPQLSNINREEWPFNFDRVVVKSSLENAYPSLAPDARAPRSERLKSGFQVYVKNCLACHRLNRVGPGDLGPDLNYPMSPTRYFVEGVLRQYIRDPQSVRAHPRSAMGAFPPAMISDAQLDDLISYLHYMAERGTK